MRWIIAALAVLSANAGAQPAPAALDSLFIRIDRVQSELAEASAPLFRGATDSRDAQPAAAVEDFLSALSEMNQWVMAAKFVECERDKEIISSFAALRYGPALALSEDALAAVRAFEPDTEEQRVAQARAIEVIQRFYPDTELLIGAP